MKFIEFMMRLRLGPIKQDVGLLDEHVAVLVELCRAAGAWEEIMRLQNDIGAAEDWRLVRAIREVYKNFGDPQEGVQCKARWRAGLVQPPGQPPRPTGRCTLPAGHENEPGDRGHLIYGWVEFMKDSHE